MIIGQVRVRYQDSGSNWIERSWNDVEVVIGGERPVVTDEKGGGREVRRFIGSIHIEKFSDSKSVFHMSDVEIVMEGMKPVRTDDQGKAIGKERFITIRVLFGEEE